jgi:hypothetical protein
MSDDEKLIVEACMNCKNYIHGLCLDLDHLVEDDDWCGGYSKRWKAMMHQTATRPPLSGRG